MQLLLTLLCTVAIGSDGFEPVKQAEDCDIELRDETHPDGAAMRAKCHWPEIDAKRAGPMMDDLNRYAEFIWPIAESRVVRAEPERRLVYQRQHIFGMTDREVLLWVNRTVEGDTTQIAWVAASEEPLTQARGTIRTPKNTGHWQVAPHPDGGSTVEHEIAIQAGGPKLPRWLLNMIRMRGFVSVMRDVRAAAAP